MAKSVKQQLLERGLNINEVIRYTKAFGGVRASIHYGFGNIAYEKFYRRQTGQDLPPGKINRFYNETVYGRCETKITKYIPILQARIKELEKENAALKAQIELESVDGSEYEIGDFLALSHI